MRFSTIVLGWLAFVAVASASPPSLDSVAPPVAQGGTTATVKLTGSRLTDPTALLFYAPGLVCKKLATEGESVVAEIEVAADCKLGQHPFRLATKGGASELRLFSVTRFPVVVELPAKHATAATAQVVEMNRTVAGVIDTGDVDVYAVSLKKGQRLSVEVAAVRLGSPTLDPVVAIHSPDGKRLVEVDDDPLFRQDPHASVIAAVDGVYTVSVSDSADGGGASDRYTLTLGTFLRPSAVYPAGGPLGQKTKVELFGIPGGPVSQTVEPTKADFAFYPADAGGIAPSPNPFRVSSFPNVLASEKPSAAVAWPVAFNGIIDKPGATGEFLLEAKKGDCLEVSAFAFQIGSPLDPVVSIYDAAGKLLAKGDDDETQDCRFQWTCPANGRYMVKVGDKRGKGDPRFIYRVEIDKPKPSVEVFLASAARKSQQGNVVVVPRGGRTAAYIAVKREGVSGEATLTLTGLPEGVAIAGKPIIGADEYFVPVIFDASGTAPLGATLIDVSGKVGSTTGGFTERATLIGGPGDSRILETDVSKLCVVVVEEVPYAVTILAPTTPLVVDGTIAVPVKVVRKGEFVGPLDVSFPLLPPGVETPATVTIPADKTDIVVTLTASQAAEVGSWPMFVEVKPTREVAKRDPLGAGGATGGTPPTPGMRRPKRGGASTTVVASQAISVTVSAPSITAKIAPATTESGKTIGVSCVFDAKAAVPAGFTATLVGLPPRAKAEPIVVAAGAKRLDFKVVVDDTTPLGAHDTLICELVGKVDGQAVTWRIGRPGTLTVAAPGSVKTDAMGNALSPLEALRREAAKKE